MKNAAILGLSQIGLQCKNLDASLYFYQHCLGLDLVYDERPNIALLAIQNIFLTLTCDNKSIDCSIKPSPVIYFTVDDIFAIYQQLSNEHINFEQSPRLTSQFAQVSIWQALLRDPDGHLIGLQSTV